MLITLFGIRLFLIPVGNSYNGIGILTQGLEILIDRCIETRAHDLDDNQGHG